MYAPPFQFNKLMLKTTSFDQCDSSNKSHQIRNDSDIDNAHLKKFWWKNLLG